MTVQTLCLFEDEAAANFFPLADTRHVSSMLVGTRTLGGRAAARTDAQHVVLHGRRHLRALGGFTDRVPADAHEEILFVNGLCLVDSTTLEHLRRPGSWILRSGGRVAAARMKGDFAVELDWSSDFLPLHRLEGIDTLDAHDVRLFEYLWELIAENRDTLRADAPYAEKGLDLSCDVTARLINPGAVLLADRCRIDAGVILDASDGPVVIDRDARVMHSAVIMGPAYIGEGSVIKVGARIYPGTSIGLRCKVGGEIEDSIFIGYSNKQHDGFVGHSYVGAWVNLGADTNTSDLKNNYGPVRVDLGGRTIDTGRILLGSLIGDHVKTGINTMLNTGTVIGVGANVFGGGFPPKSIGRFAWGPSEIRYRVEEMIEDARHVMARRGVDLTAEVETLLRYLHDL